MTDPFDRPILSTTPPHIRDSGTVGVGTRTPNSPNSKRCWQTEPGHSRAGTLERLLIIAPTPDADSARRRPCMRGQQVVAPDLGKG